MKPYGVRKCHAHCWCGCTSKKYTHKVGRRRARAQAKRTFRIIGRDIEIDTRYY